MIILRAYIYRIDICEYIYIYIYDNIITVSEGIEEDQKMLNSVEKSAK